MKKIQELQTRREREVKREGKKERKGGNYKAIRISLTKKEKERKCEKVPGGTREGKTEKGGEVEFSRSRPGFQGSN